VAKYVEELPQLELTPEQEDRLVQYLAAELDACETDRGQFIDQLKDEIEAYEAPMKGPKIFPWRNASNMTVPVIGSMVDTIFPRVHATVYGSSTYITIEEWPGELADHAKAWQDALQWIFENELDIENVSNSWFMEAIIHGTSVVKLTWERLEREIIAYSADGKIIKKERQEIKNQPVLTHVPLSEFYIPMGAKSIKDAEWCAHRIRSTYGQLKLREFNGLYKNVDTVTQVSEFSGGEYEDHRDMLEGSRQSLQEEFHIYEVWCDYDLDGDGLQKPILVTYHRPTNTILRVQANPYNHKRKPFREIVYFPRHDRFFGFGLARQLMAIQEEISTLHNQRIDNATIANTRMWKVVAGSRADQTFQGAAPGLKVLVDQQDEIEALEIGNTVQAAFENEKIALQYAQQRSGIADFVNALDFGKGGGRQTATQTVAMMQEARTRFNWTLEQVRAAIQDIACMTTDLYEQFGADDRGKWETILGERASLVGELLSGADRPLSAVLSLQVTASSASSNKAIEQQNLLAMMQMLEQQTLNFEMPLINIILNPQAPQALRDYALEKLDGSRAMMRRIMETVDVRNAQEILGSTEALREAADQPAPVPGALPVGGGAVPGQGAAGPSGMVPPNVQMAGPMGGGAQPASNSAGRGPR
jgi:hypothetical protein